MSELGLITPERAAAALPDLVGWDDPEDLLDVLELCGVSVSVHGEDVDGAEDAYRSVLEEAAALTGGAITVSDIELASTGSYLKYLNFRINGEPTSWTIEQESDDYLDQGSVADRFQELDPGGTDPRLFHSIPAQDAGDDDIYLLATPEQAQALRDEFGLDIEIRSAR
jgi:hypothetical protein